MYALDEKMLTPEGANELFELQKSDDEEKPAEGFRTQAGCTSTVCLILPTAVICANAGDSRSICSISENAEPLSYDHKPDNEKEKQRIEAAGGSVVNGRVDGNLAVARALGDFTYKDYKEGGRDD